MELPMQNNGITLDDYEARYKALIQVIPDQVLIFDDTGNLLECHSSSDPTPFLIDDNKLGKSISELFPSNIAEMFKKAINSSLETGLPQVFIYPHRVHSQPGYYEVRTTPFTNGKLLALIHDVSERLKLEQAPLLFSTALQMTTESVIITDLKGSIVDVNEAGLMLFGVKNKSDLIHLDFFGMILPEERDTAVKGMQTVLQKGYIKNIEHRILTSDNRQVSIELSMSMMSDPDKNFIGLVIVARDVSQRRETEEKLRDISSKDGLTSLQNRFAFEEKIAEMESGNLYPISVVMMDMDDLKYVNDNFGHSTGDELLKQLAQVLKSSFRQDDFIARIGGDEFVVLMPHTSQAILAQAISRLKGKMDLINKDRPFFKVSISIGGYTADADTTLKKALFLADELMYQEKTLKKNKLAADI
jgi:diguanylate cyclase (GGDEF)-like protein/PAS domain S-box-containing protein